MTRFTAPLPMNIDEHAVASRRRGACPSLALPMRTGDGLLVRLRPAESSLTPRQLNDISRASARFGNGVLEVTARGNLQIRGLREETVGPLAEAIAALGIAVASGVAIEVPPLAGFDPGERADPRPLAARLGDSIRRQPALKLAPKLSIVIDGGGRFHLGDIAADIRLTAVGTDASVEISWLLSIAGDARAAKRIAVFSEVAAVDAVMAVLSLLDEIGPQARGRDLDAAALAARFSGGGTPEAVAITTDPAPLAAGIHDFGAAGAVLGLGLAFCQMQADNLSRFLDRIEAMGARDIRLAPAHGLLIPGLDGGTAVAAQALAAQHGFRISPDDPGNHIALCVGAKGCASACFDTHVLAQALIGCASDLIDGSLQLHLSGCSKGCAHPAPAALTVTGTPSGYGLVVNGPASASPDAYIAANDVISAFDRLSALVRDNKDAGETARSCLARLGTDRIASAMRQG